MRASDAKQFIGKVVKYYKAGRSGASYGVVQSTVGRNIILEDDALWAPDIQSMEFYEEAPRMDANGKQICGAGK